MHAATLTTQLEHARDVGLRVALGFQHRLMMIDRISSVSASALPGGDEGGRAIYDLVGLVYDTAHSRNATAERVFFESSEVVYLAVPAVSGMDSDRSDARPTGDDS